MLNSLNAYSIKGIRFALAVKNIIFAASLQVSPSTVWWVSLALALFLLKGSLRSHLDDVDRVPSTKGCDPREICSKSLAT